MRIKVYNSHSLRDGDGKHEELQDEPPITRLRLQCFAAENLLLTNEVLTTLSVTWEDLKTGISEWLKVNTTHEHYSDMQAFSESEYDRRNHNIKHIRNDLMGIIGSDKPWEIAIGQVIAGLAISDSINFSNEGSIYTFLGEKTTKCLLPKTSSDIADTTAV